LAEKVVDESMVEPLFAERPFGLGTMLRLPPQVNLCLNGGNLCRFRPCLFVHVISLVD
jgi:hypothetical protein